MSTKIYDGVRIEVASAYELTQLVKSIRERLLPIAQQEYYKALAKMLEQAYAYQKYQVNLDGGLQNFTEIKDTAPDSLVSVLSQTARQTINANKSAQTILEFVRELDFDVKLMVFALPDGRFLGIPYAENSALFNALMETPEIKEYGYWDNTDKPTEISKKAWKKRKDDWNLALPGIGVPLEEGFEYKIVSSDVHVRTYLSKTVPLVPYYTPNAEYKRQIATQIIREKKYKEFLPEYGEDRAMTVLLHVSDYIKNHPDEVQEVADGLDISLDSI